MSTKLQKWLLGASLSLWVLWIFMLYLGYHPMHMELIVNHPYSGFLLFFAVLLVSLGFYSHKRLKGKKKWSISFRGITLIGVFLLFGLVFLFQFRSAINLERTPGATAASFFVFNSCWYLLLFVALGLALQAVGSILTDHLDKIKKYSLFDIAVGCMVMAFISSILGLMHLLYGAVLGLLLLGAVWYKRELVVQTLKAWVIHKHSWRIRQWWQLPVALVGMLFLAVYWIGGIKAFASGFDGSALYANLAHMIADYHALPGAYQAYGWSLVMSWGELLFGSLTFSILLSQFVFLPALLLAYQILRRWLNLEYALLAVVLVLSLPMLGFQTMVDEKIDLGLLFISLAAVYLLLEWSPARLGSWSRKEFFDKQTALPVLLLGALLGFCFAIKYTTVFLFVAVIGLLLWRLGHAILYWGWILFFAGFIFLSGFYEWGNLPLGVAEAEKLGIGFALSGLALMSYQFWRSKAILPVAFRSMCLIGLGFGLSFAPWAGKHLSENGYTISVSSLLYGQPDRIELDIPPEYLSGFYNQSPLHDGQLKSFTRLTSDQGDSPANSEPAAEASQEEDAKLIGNATREELQRYIGYEEGILRYLSVPTDLSFKINIPDLRHQEIGFLFLAFFPLLFFGAGKNKWLRNSLAFLLLSLYFAAFFWTLTEASTAATHIAEVENTFQARWQLSPAYADSGFVPLWKQIQQPLILLASALIPLWQSISSLPALIYIPLLLLIIFGLSLSLKPRFRAWSNDLKSISVLLLGVGIFWGLLSNSITWYAMILWVFLPSYLVYYFQKPDALFSLKTKSVVSPVLGGIIGLSLLMNTLIALSSSQPNQPKAQLYNWPMVEYLSQSTLNQQKTFRLFDPVSQSICEVLNKDEEARIYRINTYLQFHIDKNDRRVFEDNQLQRFAEILNATKTQSNFFDILMHNNIRYILYDINTPSLDRTPEQSLRAKCTSLLTLLLSSNRAELVLTDHYVEDPNSPAVRLPNGQRAQAKQGLSGKTVHQGRVALFKIN